MVSYPNHTTPWQASQRRFTSTTRTFFRHKLTTALPETAEEEEWPYKYLNILIIKSSEKNVPDARSDCGASCIPSGIALPTCVHVNCLYSILSFTGLVSQQAKL